MDFPFGQSVVRDRRAQVPDTYNPDRTVPATTWAGAASAPVPNAWVGDMSIAAANTASRSLTTASASLYCPAGSDVRRGDRIRCDGHTYAVLAVPPAAVNPFSGWRPPIEIPLEEVHDA